MHCSVILLVHYASDKFQQNNRLKIVKEKETAWNVIKRRVFSEEWIFHHFIFRKKTYVIAVRIPYRFCSWCPFNPITHLRGVVPYIMLTKKNSIPVLPCFSQFPICIPFATSIVRVSRTNQNMTSDKFILHFPVEEWTAKTWFFYYRRAGF